MRTALACALLLIVSAFPAHGAAGECWDTARRCHDITDYRADHNLPGLDQSRGLQDAAKAWARHMAGDGILAHSPGAYRGEWSEIVGTGPDWPTVLAAWDQSDPHRAILLDPDLEHVGIGTARDDTGRLWTAVVFR